MSEFHDIPEVVAVVKSCSCWPVVGTHLFSLNCFCVDIICMCVCVSVCVCLPSRLLITSDMMWYDMNPIRLVKQVLQLIYGNCSHYC